MVLVAESDVLIPFMAQAKLPSEQAINEFVNIAGLSSEKAIKWLKVCEKHCLYGCLS